MPPSPSPRTGLNSSAQHSPRHHVRRGVSGDLLPTGYTTGLTRMKTYHFSLTAVLITLQSTPSLVFSAGFYILSTVTALTRPWRRTKTRVKFCTTVCQQSTRVNVNKSAKVTEEQRALLFPMSAVLSFSLNSSLEVRWVPRLRV